MCMYNMQTNKQTKELILSSLSSLLINNRPDVYSLMFFYAFWTLWQWPVLLLYIFQKNFKLSY